MNVYCYSFTLISAAEGAETLQKRLPSSFTGKRKSLSRRRSIKLREITFKSLSQPEESKNKIKCFFKRFLRGWLSRQVVEWDQLGRGRKGVLYRSASTRAGIVFCSVCICLLFVNLLGWKMKRKFFQFCIAWENKIVRNGGGNGSREMTKT